MRKRHLRTGVINLEQPRSQGPLLLGPRGGEDPGNEVEFGTHPSAKRGVNFHWYLPLSKYSSTLVILLLKKLFLLTV